MTTMTPEQKLLIAVIVQARKDARRGDQDAQDFLDNTLPEFRTFFREHLNPDQPFYTVKHSRP